MIPKKEAKANQIFKREWEIPRQVPMLSGEDN
jgi:hypothetical protein